MKKLKFIIIIFILLFVYMYISNITLIPNKLILISGENYNFKKLPGIDIVETSTTVSSNQKSNNLSINLLGFEVRDITVNVLDNVEVIPVGNLIGLKLYTNGVLIVGMSEIENINNETEKPYENLDIQAGDTILKVNNLEIEDIDSLKREINNSNGENLNLTILKANGTIYTSNIKPVKVSSEDYKLGLWVKDAATGVGTLTYYNPDTKEFAALGHGITDTDTNSLIQIDDGEVVTSKVLSIQKAEEGKPGEIKGTIINQQTIGKVYKNTEFGIFGELSELSNIKIDFSKKMQVALRNEIEEGKATIMCSLDGKNVEEYEININKIYLNNNDDNKSMQIEITDSKLLEKTGGIIRGLSGAPIIQNGKFVGAVTNVLVNSPNKGYAIFADIMIKEMESTD